MVAERTWFLRYIYDMSERALRSLKRTVNDATKHLDECKETLKIIEKGEPFELKCLEILYDKLTISMKFVSDKLNNLNDNQNNDPSSDADVENVLMDSEAVLENIEIISQLTKQVIEKERLEKEKEREREFLEREKEREYLHEKERKDFDHACKLELLVRESEERIKMERMQIEKEIELNRLKVEEVKIKESFSNHRNAIQTVSTKLPKLHITPFDGNVMKWQSFWDAFKSAIHDNSSLTAIDKFNYLRSFLQGKARNVIEGLDLTSTNYEHAIELLGQRFGKKSVVLSTRYSKLNSISPSASSTFCLRKTLDEIRVHLRSLESLDEIIEHTQMVVLIQSKFPREVLRELEIRKEKGETWTVSSLIENLECYISSIEVTDLSLYDKKKDEEFDAKRSGKEFHHMPSRHLSYQSTRYSKPTGHALMSNEPDTGDSRSAFVDRVTKKCRYCKGDH